MSGDERALKTEFLRALAHAIRSPLGVVDGSLGELEGAPADDLPMLVAMARRNVARLTQLADRLDDIAEVEASELRPELGELDVREAVEQVVARSGVADVELEVEGHARASADPRLLARVLSLVLDNAARLRTRTVRVRVESLAAVRIHVEDDGPGLGDDAEPLFERYRDGRARGCGRELATSLSLARDYARAMGGELTLWPREGGRGARCTLELRPAKARGPGR